MSKTFIAIGVALASTTALSAESNCASFAKQIDQSQRIVAMLRSELRNSKNPSSIDARIQIEVALMQMNLSILLKSCPAPTKPINLDAYAIAAGNCQMAVARDEVSQPAACDISKWSPPD